MPFDARSILRAIREFTWTLQFKGFLEQLRINLEQDSFYPNLARKSRFVRCMENLAWYVRYGEINRYYNSYGFDVKHLRNQNDYLARNRFRQQRNDLNLYVTPFGYTSICVLRDKMVFSGYMSKYLGAQYLPTDIGRILPDGSVLVWNSDHATEEQSFSSFFGNRAEGYFIKRLCGECGEGCYLITGTDPSSGTMTINGIKQAQADFLAETAGSEYLIQEQLSQHPDLSRLNPSCVNTIRIITIIGRKSQSPRIFAHFLRLGVESVVDNRATGGLAVLIDEAGILRGAGIGHRSICYRHPVTGVEFEGYSLPYWKEVQELVIRAHQALPGIPAIGWDVAISPSGPVLIEGNDNWEICGVQDTMGGAKNRWRQFIQQ